MDQTPRNSTDKAVLVALAHSVSGDELVCTPYQEDIAALACCSVDSVQRALRRLERVGLIQLERRWDSAGQSLPNKYRLGASTGARAEPQGKVPIPPALRWAVFERDDFRCRECGSRRFLQADHVHPESKGGATTLANLQTLCASCNARKRDRIGAEVAS